MKEKKWHLLWSCKCLRLSVAIFLHIQNVCVDNVLKTMKENANKASSILLTAIPLICTQEDWTHTIKALKAIKCFIFFLTKSTRQRTTIWTTAQSSIMLPKQH
ncbi:unnamed protein product [Oncorhynchus mykiss]|uniref:Uncharacterized protein n=1 Tax=Oncorhynchus mykiss TaxID=8022 RepID=A0A060Y8S9_ONCMY|nr:unnamed protein product [Oncorhynchus mykiss]